MYKIANLILQQNINIYERKYVLHVILNDILKMEKILC